MNKQKVSKEQKAEAHKAAGQDRKKELERLILEYTEELAEDINLRLLAQQEIEPAGFRRGRYHTGEVLYVESIIITDIRYPAKKKRGSSFKELGNNVKNILKRR
ncbi:MAG: hypothetical protein HDR13_01570 [Lachnospiraceae bacterium]|nr:hypothetical protein [Lachnospiraceae bacterium]